MEEAGELLEFPSREDIIELNRAHIEISGGFHDGNENLREPGNLEWVLEAIQYPLFGAPRYPTIEDKAAQLAWIIIDGHVFNDGNKRTRMSAMFIFLRANHFALKSLRTRRSTRLLAPSDDEVITVALAIADSARRRPYTPERLVNWIQRRLIPVLV